MAKATTPNTQLATFAPLDLLDLERQETVLGFNSGSAYFKFKDGRNILRMLPAKPGERALVGMWKHFVAAGPGGRPWQGSCPLRTAKQECPVCSLAAKLSRGPAADQKLAKDLLPRQRYLFVVIDRNTPDAGPQLVEVGASIYKGIKDILRMGEDPTNPGPDGFDLVIEKTGSGLTTEYKCMAQRKPSVLSPDPGQAEEWLDACPSLAEQIVVLSSETIAGALASTVVADLLIDLIDGVQPAPRKSAAVIAAAPLSRSGRTQVKAQDVSDYDDDDDDV